MCEALFSAESFGDWMEQMKPHYGEAHTDVMQEKAGLAPEEQQKEMQTWMSAARERFNSMPDTA